MSNGVATVGYEVKATEYGSPDGSARAWWTERDLMGMPLLAVAFRDSTQSEPWSLMLGRPGGRAGLSYAHRYRSLVRARMMLLGGNGHIHRGHSSVAEVRTMTRPNILALAAR